MKSGFQGVGEEDGGGLWVVVVAEWKREAEERNRSHERRF